MDDILNIIKERISILAQASVENIEILERDLLKFIKKLDEEPGEEIWLRAIVRTYVSLIEAYLYGMKQQALLLSQSGKAIIRLDAKEEHELNINRDNMKENFKIAFKYLAKVWGFEYEMDLNKDLGWQKYCEMKNIRDRLTHPKKNGDLRITRQNHGDVVAAALWYRKQAELFDKETEKRMRKMKKKNEGVNN